MQWNENKCSVTHMKKGALDQSTNDVKLEESAVIVRLMIGEQYKFLVVQGNLKKEDKLVRYRGIPEDSINRLAKTLVRS